MLRPNSPLVAGQRLPRLDGPDKITGRYTYGADFQLPGMLFGKIVRRSVPHALIKRLDVTPALNIPGVRAVVTAADAPPLLFGMAVKDETVLATDRVRFAGQPIAAIAATSIEIAERAAAAVEVEFEPLPIVHSTEEALREGAPLIHPDWASYGGEVASHAKQGNLASRMRIHYGDVEAAFRDAYRVYEHRFTTPLVHAGYTEMRSATATWDGDGSLTVWTNGQLPFGIQADLAEILDMPLSKIRVIVPGIGGGFGGKLQIGVEHFAALLARKAGRPVKITTTVGEELAMGLPRQAATIDLKTAVARNGQLLAKQAKVVLDCGAYTGSGPYVAAVSLHMIAGPYRIPAVNLIGMSVYTNKVPTGAFRATAGPINNFAVESQMDLIADDLGIDPLDLRLKNIVREGDKGLVGETLRGVSVEECLRKAASAIGWGDRRPEPGRGKGIACAMWLTTGGSSGVFVKLNGDGTVSLNSGAVELGTGALTGAAQILAEELALDAADVRIATVDTHSSPFDYGAQGSRTTFSVGNACRAAAASLREQIFAVAAKMLDAPAAQMSLREKSVVFDNHRVSLAEIAQTSLDSGGGIIAHGTFVAKSPSYDPSRLEDHLFPVFNSPSFHAHAAEVSVDESTGEVSVERYVVAQDVGFAINPTYIEGQIHGGVGQGLGQALMEEIVYDADGFVVNATLADYKLPTSLDIPEIETLLVEQASEAGPYGAKGVGEPPCVMPMAAIANAVASAVDVRIPSVPITPEKVLLALRRKRSEEREKHEQAAPKVHEASR